MLLKYLICISLTLLLSCCLSAFSPLSHMYPAGCMIASFSHFLFETFFLKASRPLCISFNVHFPTVTRGNIDEEGQVGW